MKKYHPIKGKVVYIIFQSKGLGDTLAWFPYVEEFRKKYRKNSQIKRNKQRKKEKNKNNKN